MKHEAIIREVLRQFAEDLEATARTLRDIANDQYVPPPPPVPPYDPVT